MSIIFREVQVSDRDQLMSMHNDFFPVRYSTSFYDDMVQGIGMFGSQLCTIIAEDQQSGTIVGFAISQILKYPLQVEDYDLFANPQPSHVMYILTLGVAASHRRQGLAVDILNRCRSKAESHVGCGAVFLHVIHYNTAAMQLYSRMSFEKLRCLEDFYHFDNQSHRSFLFIRYLHDYHGRDKDYEANQMTPFGLLLAVREWGMSGLRLLVDTVKSYLPSIPSISSLSSLFSSWANNSDSRNSSNRQKVAVAVSVDSCGSSCTGHGHSHGSAGSSTPFRSSSSASSSSESAV